MSLVTYVLYEQFKDIPQQTRNTILKKLGVSGGGMRSEAKATNPITIVAFCGTKPIGWATLEFHSKEVSVFVASAHRNKGIGTELVAQLRKRVAGTFICFPFNKKGLDFYSRFDNIKCDKDNLEWIDEQEIEKIEKFANKNNGNRRNPNWRESDP